MIALSKEAIQQVVDIQPVEVEVPEWGGSVFVKPLTAAQMEKTQARYEKASDSEKLTLMIINCVCDEKGQNLFSKDDVNWLMDKNMKVLLKLVGECNKVNGLDTEEVEKNLEVTQ